MAHWKTFLDSREEVIFFLLLILIVAAVPCGYLSGLEAVGSVCTIYGLLLGSKVLKARAQPEEASPPETKKPEDFEAQVTGRPHE